MEVPKERRRGRELRSATDGGEGEGGCGGGMDQGRIDHK